VKGNASAQVKYPFLWRCDECCKMNKRHNQ
jgi:hypothetical protein